MNPESTTPPPTAEVKVCGDCKHHKRSLIRCMLHSKEGAYVTMYATDFACAHYESVLTYAPPMRESALEQPASTVVAYLAERRLEIETEIAGEKLAGNSFKADCYRHALAEIKALEDWLSTQRKT